ncbi:MAG: exo-beta-N-acetylmuramidase NamZ domain-containing protein [Phycisphaeraceae bacterium]
MTGHATHRWVGWIARLFVLVFTLSGCTAAAEVQSQAPGALTGIDVLTRDGMARFEGQRIGLITNHTGLNRDGVTTIRLFHGEEGTNLTAIFSPEHGIAGQLDQSDIADGTDPATGLPVFSLYGKTRRPTAEMLKHIDTLVFDIQDIGTRFYTYISTMGEAMVAAAQHGKRFVVLDRPNPLGGVRVAGPMLDAGKQSFVGWHALPVRHGMTIGELARMIKDERGLDLQLDVVKCENWSRAQGWAQTGLTWVNPSPNMRSLTQALLYPGVGLLETTNVSVGRGTDTPFEVIGAPWIDQRELANRLNGLELPGVAFVPVRFTPDASTFEGEACGGVNLVITDHDAFEPVSTGLAIAATLRQTYPDDWDHGRYPRLLGNDAVMQRIDAKADWQDVVDASRRGVDAFMQRRERYLIYE